MANVVREAVEGIGISKLPEDLGCPAIFTEVAIPEIVKIPNVKPDMEQLLSVMVDAKIVSLRIIDTPVGTSHEGQKLTGKKLSIELLLKQKVKYIADEPTQSVHAAHFEHTVSSIWVVVPKEINCKSIETLLMQGKLIVTPYIEDIYGEQLDKRTIFKNITVLIHVTSPCLLPSKADLKLLKTANTSHAKVGDIITYSVVVKNAGTVQADPVSFKDPLSSCLEYVTGTFKVNGISTPGDPTSSSGVDIGPIAPGTSKTITFEAEVTCIPYPCSDLVNVSQVQYSYINCNGKTKTDISKSNTVIIPVDKVSLNLVKTGTPNPVLAGGEITYTVVIKNEGTITLNDINFKDTVTNGTFIDNSFTINDSIQPGINPTNTEINLGSLDPDESIYLTYKVKATDDSDEDVTNSATANYKYSLDSCDDPVAGTPVTDSEVIDVLAPPIP